MNPSFNPGVKDLLKKYRVFPSKGLGQNFLIDKCFLQKFIEVADLTKEDTVLEVGPGIGNLTRELAKKAKRVIAVEKDPKMVEILKETLKDFRNVEIIQADIRKFQIQDTKHKIQNIYRIVGNLPFYLTAPVIRKFLETEKPPKEMVFIIQKEVAQRICARPPDMNLLAVSVQFYGNPEIKSYISKRSFWPSPKVDGAILRIAPQIPPDKKLINTDLFFKVVKAGFSQPRKMLINNLAKNLNQDKEKIKNWLLKNGIQPSQRAETLNLQDWKNLTKTFPHLKLDV